MAKGKKTGGRVAGTPNKLTRTVREAFEQAFEIIQGDQDANLVTWARQNPTDFYRLAAKLIPTDVNAHLAGGLQIQVITGVPQTAGAETDQ